MDTPNGSLRDLFIDGAAHTFFVIRWTDEQEDAGADIAGHNLFELADRNQMTPADVQQAIQFAMQIEQETGRPLEQAIQEAAAREGAQNLPEFARWLGHHLAMEHIHAPQGNMVPIPDSEFEDPNGGPAAA